jgi:hypothetical protein
MKRYLLAVTALGEGGIGLLLLISPNVLQSLLFGEDVLAPASAVIARIAGVALVTIGVACWFARLEVERSRAQSGLLAGVFIYDMAAALVLASAGMNGLHGVALWPAVLAHVILGTWSVVCLLKK